MITIQQIPEGRSDKVRVLFTMRATDRYGCLYLVGWFDEWSESVYRMQCTDKGVWFLTLELEPGCEYHYCFRTDDGTWLYDPDTPCVPEPYGAKNSFVISHSSVSC
jgi:1,4-alpha-glucan branching enzyme